MSMRYREKKRKRAAAEIADICKRRCEAERNKAEEQRHHDNAEREEHVAAGATLSEQPSLELQLTSLVGESTRFPKELTAIAVTYARKHVAVLFRQSSLFGNQDCRIFDPEGPALVRKMWRDIPRHCPAPATSRETEEQLRFWESDSERNALACVRNRGGRTMALFLAQDEFHAFDLDRMAAGFHSQACSAFFLRAYPRRRQIGELMATSHPLFPFTVFVLSETDGRYLIESLDVDSGKWAVVCDCVCSHPAGIVIQHLLADPVRPLLYSVVSREHDDDRPHQSHLVIDLLAKKITCMDSTRHLRNPAAAVFADTLVLAGGHEAVYHEAAGIELLSLSLDPSAPPTIRGSKSIYSRANESSVVYPEWRVPSPRAAASLAVLNGRLYLIGGWQRNGYMQDRICYTTREGFCDPAQQRETRPDWTPVVVDPEIDNVSGTPDRRRTTLSHYSCAVASVVDVTI